MWNFEGCFINCLNPVNEKIDAKFYFSKISRFSYYHDHHLKCLCKFINLGLIEKYLDKKIEHLKAYNGLSK